jgi:hypothetical protein
VGDSSSVESLKQQLLSLLSFTQLIKEKEILRNQEIIEEFHSYPFLDKVFSGILAGRLSDWLMNNNALSEFEMGFVKGRKAMDNVFLIKTMIDKYLRFKRYRIYWCFSDLEEAFDSTDREALWYKIRRKGISDKIVNCIKKMCNGVKFCVKCGDEEVTDC